MNVNKKFRLAVKYYQAGNLQQAENLYKEILENQPDNIDALYFLGVILQHKKDYDSAISSYRKTLHLNPHNPDVYYNLGLIFQDKAEADEAIKCYRQAIKLKPNFADVYYNLGLIFQDNAEADNAIANYKIFLQFNSKDADAYLNLGHAYQMKGQLDEAITYFQKAIQFNTDLPEAYCNLGSAFRDKVQPEVAIPYYQKAIQLYPDFADAHWGLARSLLLAGNFNQGWKEYEWRWKSTDYLKYSCFHRPVNFTQPILNGSDIAGHTVLIYAEQGLGDEIQFVRYAPLVAQHGAKVIIECHKELSTLLQPIESVKHVIVQGEPLPDFDVQCPLLTLPLVFNTTLENIPAKVPYIFVNPVLRQGWKDKIQQDNSKMKVGLVWNGNPKNKNDMNRSIPFSKISQFIHCSDITFYSLQKGNAAEQSRNRPLGMKLVDLSEEINNFSDTAAIIENLDLTISVDTSVAHLAGALGKPIWTLIPFAPDWRWMLNREDSPWYPTMRLFRQLSPGDWESVIFRVKDELRQLLESNLLPS
jgi:tetratricopeptide (TPR) repeat protein